MSHIAIVRSSARMAHQQRSVNQAEREKLDGPSRSTSRADASTNLEDSQLSQISSMLSLSDDDDLSHEMSIRKPAKNRALSLSSANKSLVSSKFLPAPLEPLNGLSDIEAHIGGELQQANILNKLELKWTEISANFETVINHLQECSNEVMESSENCLESLVNSVEVTCDKVDNKLKALYHLMIKCDELTTKLSIVNSFRDEIKTLRKSVDTLELLYKTRPQPEQQKVSNSRN